MNRCLVVPLTRVGLGVATVTAGAYSHSSLDVSSDGRWLLYVAHTVDAATLYVSRGDATPWALTTGTIAAVWG